MSTQMDRLVEIVRTLRSPGGCPWDIEQNHESIKDGFIEEVYEFLEALDSKNIDDMKEELGDILLQVVFHSQIASESGNFNIESVAKEISDKLVRRHPHVFGDTKVDSTDEVLKNWDTIKRSEKGKEKRRYVTDGVPEMLPALMRAEKIQKKAAKVGFDWDNIEPVLDKVDEEFKEFRDSLKQGNYDAMVEEFGDIIFALVNVSRHKKISAEESLRRAIKKFEKRFHFVEDYSKRKGINMKDSSLEELDKIWNMAKSEGL